jgi:hypothetical protein
MDRIQQLAHKLSNRTSTLQTETGWKYISAQCSVHAQGFLALLITYITTQIFR